MSVVCQGERWQQRRLCVLCTLGKPIWASLSARAGRSEEPPAQPLSPLWSRRVIAALADEGLCSRCCKWDSSGLLAQCWDAEMLLPMWQHLISDSAGRNWWDPLNTACGWHLIIRREGEQGPSWLSGLRCQHRAQGSATAWSSHADLHVWHCHSESDCVAGAKSCLWPHPASGCLPAPSILDLGDQAKL